MAQAFPLETYKLLTDLLQHEEDLFWRRNEVFLVINGGMITLLGLILPRQVVAVAPAVKVISLAICTVGVIMCLLWLIVIKRGEAFYNYWYEQLDFLETQYHAPVNIFLIADEYFKKGRIKIGDVELKLGFLSRRMRIFQALMVASLIFIVVWLSLAVYLIFYT